MVENLEKSLYELAEVTLSSILRRMSFRDISPVPASTAMLPPVTEDPSVPALKGRAKHMPSNLQAKMSDDFHQEFEDVVAQWGVEIIGGVQIKTIEPKDERLRQAIAEMVPSFPLRPLLTPIDPSQAISTAKADAQRRQAEFEREVRNTKATAEKEVMVLQAQGEKEARLIQAQAEQQATIIKAQGEADSLRLLSEARLKATENDGRAAEFLTTTTAQQIALLSKQAEVLAQCKTPVFVPSASLGQTSLWARNEAEGLLTHFSNGPAKEDGTAALMPQMLVAQAMKK